MSTEKHYQSKLETITAIENGDIRKPSNIPISVYAQEAEALFKWCQDDKTELVNQGMPWELVTDLPARIGALRQTQSIWGTERFQKKEAEKQWEEKLPGAFLLRKELLHHFRFAYKNEPEPRAFIKNIRLGLGKAQMIQHLNDLSHLGKTNPGPLEQTGFDMTQLDRAEGLVKELSQLYAEATRDRNTPNDANQIRNQAYTHLKAAVDMIYKHGRYAFWRNETRKKGYRSGHLKRKRDRNRPAPTVENETEESPETTPV